MCCVTEKLLLKDDNKQAGSISEKILPYEHLGVQESVRKIIPSVAIVIIN